MGTSVIEERCWRNYNLRIWISRAVSNKLTCKPALAERETAFAFALPESLPAFPPACSETKITVNLQDTATKLRQAAAWTSWNTAVRLECTDGSWIRWKLADTHHYPTRGFAIHYGETCQKHGRRRLSAVPPNTLGAVGTSCDRPTWLKHTNYSDWMKCLFAICWPPLLTNSSPEKQHSYLVYHLNIASHTLGNFPYCLRATLRYYSRRPLTVYF